jgi:hypothetical protein
MLKQMFERKVAKMKSTTDIVRILVTPFNNFPAADISSTAGGKP